MSSPYLGTYNYVQTYVNTGLETKPKHEIQQEIEFGIREVNGKPYLYFNKTQQGGRNLPFGPEMDLSTMNRENIEINDTAASSKMAVGYEITPDAAAQLKTADKSDMEIEFVGSRIELKGVWTARKPCVYIGTYTDGNQTRKVGIHNDFLYFEAGTSKPKGGQNEFPFQEMIGSLRTIETFQINCGTSRLIGYKITPENVAELNELLRGGSGQLTVHLQPKPGLKIMLSMRAAPTLAPVIEYTLLGSFSAAVGGRRRRRTRRSRKRRRRRSRRL